MNKFDRPIVLIGGGGHASVLVDILRTQNRKILAIVCPDDISQRSAFNGIQHLKQDDDVLRFPSDDVVLVNGIGMMPKSHLKRKLNEYYLSHGYQFETVIAKSAQVSLYAVIESGVQIFAGAIVQAGASVGTHSVINSGAIIEHDCQIGCYNHIAPRATLCGQVTTQDEVYVGAGSTVIQNLKLEQGSIIGAGAIVTENISSQNICYPSRSTMKMSS
ncbi:acetyltransferase [Vibrio scophthalmi]|uniref:Putative acetyltransferase EpsM n=1 Tax=Vibrio scophthalmi TaxID=45658 RepID=A0A1C7FCE2_9VIBR|nr:acetyltransferase [Vibrio scophthalmi]ANU37725.1 Putative acetyltransferase EpsM [Vibrio scophthalmi]